MINNWKIRRSDLLFFIAYIVFLFYKIIATSTYEEIIGENIIEKIKFFSWLLLIIKILLCNKINIKLIIGYSVLIGLGIVIRMQSGSSEILELILVILAANDIEFKNIAKVTLIETIILCAIIIISSIIGLIPNYTFPRANGQYGMALGFSYVGKLSIYLLQIVFLILYLYEEKNKIASNVMLLFFFIIFTIIFCISYVRNTYIMSIIFLMLYLLVTKYKKINLNKYIKILSCIFIMCFILIFYLVVNFNSEKQIYIIGDKMLNTRLSTMNRVYETYGIAPFGTKFEMIGFEVINENYTYVDSAYISLLLRDGYIVLILIGISYTYLLRDNIEKGNQTIVIWLMIIAISSIVEDSLIQINFNCAILMLFNTIKSNEIKYKEENKIDENSNSYCNL